MKNIKYDAYSSLEKCKDEPIHLIGTIQGFGFLLVFSAKKKQLRYFSENTLSLFDLNQAKLKSEGYQLDFFLIFLGLADNISFKGDEIKIHRKSIETKIGNAVYLVQFSVKGVDLFIEIEKMDDFQSAEEFYQQNQDFIQLMNETDDFPSFSQLIAENIQGITGYDRVMVYRFDSDYNGEVFAEAINEGHESFLGLNYPHTDIPEQARKLYKKNKCRIIHDTQADQVSIFAIDESSDSLDLGDSVLRSSSPIHLKYLNNMGVRATLTLSIMIDQQLWGLIACHHYSPKHITQRKRLAATLQTDFYASQIRRWERSDEYAMVQEKEHIYQAVIEDGVKHKNLFEAITNQTYLLGLTSSNGVAVIRKGELFSFGSYIEREQIMRLHEFMQERNEHVFLTNELSKYYDEAKKYKEKVSGLLYYRLDLDGKSAIMWFRNQLSEGKKWGGNPNFKDINSPLTPRNSFESWEEEVDGKSAIWKSHEIQAGLRLCAFLEREIHITSLNEQKKKFEKLTNELKETNEELSQFNWISSHDMKEPLRKIRLFVDQIKSEENLLTKSHQMYFSRIDVAAEYMQKLINDLLNYSSLTRQENQSMILLKDLIEEAIKDLNEEDVNFQLNVNEEFKVFGVKVHLKQVLMNLLSNSVKFKSKDRPLTIKIFASKDVNFDIPSKKSKDYFRLSIEDNGIGFSQEYEEKIFKVFQRLHNQQEYKGTGIGLALCKKVMESHKGFISAEAKENIGAAFHLYFPLNDKEL
jgi:light-regulated signal transduction histidine kinase (bacteriophytochrome)